MKSLLILAMLALAVNVWGATNEFATAEVIVGIYTSPVFSAGGDITATNELVTGSTSLVHALSGDITIDTNDCHRITMTDKGIRKLAADGRICEALGRHFWRPGRPGEGEGSSCGGWYADYHPGTTYRTCRVCGKPESKTEGEWK